MRQIGFAEMSAFAEVAARRSFAKAAGQLGVSRSALSMTSLLLVTSSLFGTASESRQSETIRGIEEKLLGVRLLNRTTRSVAPTEVGLLARMAPLLDEVATALGMRRRS
jgi:DNA-binding transcriptional LysR family regulator